MRILPCITFTTVLWVTLSVACAGDAPAAAQKVWQTFSEGVAERDAEKVASVSRFPIISDDLGGGDIESEKALANKFDAIFKEGFTNCLADGNLEPGLEPGDWVVDCNGVLFGLRAQQGEYRFAYIENVNE